RRSLFEHNCPVLPQRDASAAFKAKYQPDTSSFETLSLLNMLLPEDLTSYFDPWFKRINKQLGRADGRAITHTDNLARLVDSNFVATLDRLPNLGDLEATVEGLDGRFDDVDDKIDTAEKNLEDRLEDLDSKIGDVDSYLKDSRAISQNALCTQGWQQVKPVRGTSAHGTPGLPRNFPQTVGEFWQLKELSKSMSYHTAWTRGFARMIVGDTLTELVRSYNVQGYHHWGNQGNTETRETRETRTVRTSGLVRVRRDYISPALRAAVQSHPDIAHRALAVELGLDYDKIQVNMERDSTTDSYITSSHGRKRRADSVDDTEPSDMAESSQQAARRTRIKKEE
ncbi:MAG: hypothetical protein Q9204_007929, partial [Flavoplaca sp. TL-2023a]